MSGQDNGVLKTDIVEGRQTRIIYESASGVVFHIKVLNLATLRAIQLKAESVFPYPDKLPYQKPDENAFVEGQLGPAEENPDYIRDCAAVDKERSQWTDRAIFDYAARCPKYPTHADMVAAYKDELAALREIAELPDDDYEAVLLHLVLTWNQVGVDKNGHWKPASSDYSRIIQLAIQTVALTAAEVTQGIRFFRARI